MKDQQGSKQRKGVEEEVESVELVEDEERVVVPVVPACYHGQAFLLG